MWLWKRLCTRRLRLFYPGHLEITWNLGFLVKHVSHVFWASSLWKHSETSSGTCKKTFHISLHMSFYMILTTQYNDNFFIFSLIRHPKGTGCTFNTNPNFKPKRWDWNGKCNYSTVKIKTDNHLLFISAIIIRLSSVDF